MAIARLTLIIAELKQFSILQMACFQWLWEGWLRVHDCVCLCLCVCVCVCARVLASSHVSVHCLCSSTCDYMNCVVGYV